LRVFYRVRECICGCTKLSQVPMGRSPLDFDLPLVDSQALLFTSSIQLLISFNLLIHEAKQTIKASKANAAICPRQVSQKGLAAVGLQHHVTHDVSPGEDDGQDLSVKFIYEQTRVIGKYGIKYMSASPCRRGKVAGTCFLPAMSSCIPLYPPGLEGPEFSNCASPHQSLS